MENEQMMALTALPHRRRGDYSSKFRGVSITSNHFHVNLATFETIYVFNVIITPRVMHDNSQLRNKILNKIHPEIGSFIVNPVISGNTIYSVQAPLQTEKEITCEQDEIEYTVKIKKVKEINVKEKPKVLIQFLNNALRNIMNRLGYIEIGRSNKYFNQKNRTNLDKLVMFSGYKSNFIHSQNGLNLRVDVAKKIVREETALDYIDRLYKVHSDKDRDEKRNLVKNELVGKIVMTNYGKTNYFRIQDIVYVNMDEVFISTKDEQSISLKDYYWSKYHVQFKPKQPLLKAQSKRKSQSDTPTLLIPQLCLMTGIPQDYDEFRRKKVSEATIRNPIERKKDIESFMKQVSGTEGFDCLNKIGIKIEQQMQQVQARIIPAPKLELGEHNYVEQGKQAFFNLYAKPIYGSKHSVNLGVIYFDGVDANSMLSIFESTSRNLKVKLTIEKIKGGQLDSRRALDVISTLIDKAVEKQCNICLIVLPSFLRSSYKKIKTKALLESRITCQVAVDKTLQRKNANSIYTKILLQIIAKRGNTLWVPKGGHKYENVMMIAFDSAKFKKGNILSIVATVNSTFTSIYSKTVQYDGPIDRFQPMVQLFTKAVTFYAERNNSLPKQIIIFHNAVSFDQVALMKEHFIQPCLKQEYKSDPPTLTFIMVNTRNDQRFFEGSGDSIRNLKAGSLISSGVVSENYDFYMVSQFTTKGSTVPNHYEVIYTDSKTEEGILQELIFSQCFNYVNWTGSIKVPGVLQYAKKCAKFHSEVLQSAAVKDDLEAKLYYI